MWGCVLTRILALEDLVERTRNGRPGKRARACGHANSLTLFGLPENRRVKEKKMTTKNTKTNRYRIPADQIQNLEIDRNGRIAPRLHDLEPLENTLLSVLYPGIQVASVDVPAEPLDDYEQPQVENA